MIVSVESRGDDVLTVVTDELEEGKHGKTSVLELRSLTLGKDIGGKVKFSGGGTVEAPVVNGSNGEDDLGPSEEGDSINGGNSVGDVVGVELSGDEIVSETVGLRSDVSEDGKHGYTSVLDLSKAVLVKFLLRDTVGKTSGVKESGGCENTNLVFKGPDSGGGTSGLGGGEGSGRAGKSSENSELHHLDFLLFELIVAARRCGSIDVRRIQHVRRPRMRVEYRSSTDSRGSAISQRISRLRFLFCPNNHYKLLSKRNLDYLFILELYK